MDDVSTRLADTFASALPGYLTELLTERGWPIDEDAIGRGVEWLDENLGDLLDRPYVEQLRSPLEIVQEATRVVGDSLEEAGVEPPQRDTVGEQALPGDMFDLAPASSQALGEAAWEAHIAWGIAKAQAFGARVMRKPLALHVGRNLMDRTRLESSAAAAGYDLRPWSGDPGSAVLAFVDLTSEDADEAIQTLAAADVRVIAFGRHVDDLAMARAGSLGAAEVLTRSRFFARLAERFAPII